MSTSRRVAINTMSNWIAMAIQLGVNMFLLAYMLRYLDEGRFGIFRLAVTISVGVSFLSFGMAASVLRLASESIAAKDWDRLSGTLSVSRTILVIAAAVGLLGAGLIMLTAVAFGGHARVVGWPRSGADCPSALCAALVGQNSAEQNSNRGLNEARQRTKHVGRQTHGSPIKEVRSL